jgi:hypothetical protein
MHRTPFRPSFTALRVTSTVVDDPVRVIDLTSKVVRPTVRVVDDPFQPIALTGKVTRVTVKEACDPVEAIAVIVKVTRRTVRLVDDPVAVIDLSVTVTRTTVRELEITRRAIADFVDPRDDRGRDVDCGTETRNETGVVRCPDDGDDDRDGRADASWHGATTDRAAVAHRVQVTR